jgi:hypothetical protein
MTQFNITNSKIDQLNDKGDNIKVGENTGNIAVSQTGTAVSSSGAASRVQASIPKTGVLTTLWKWIKSALAYFGLSSGSK